MTIRDEIMDHPEHHLQKSNTKNKRKSVLASFSFFLEWPLNH